MNCMKRRKVTPKSIQPTPKAIYASLTVIALWWVFWLGSQALFMVDIPVVTKWLVSSCSQVNFLSLTLWIFVVNLIALAVYHGLQREYSFLKIKDKWDVLAYLLPMGLVIVLLLTKSSAFGVPILIYISAMVVTNFCQELLTTGFMQTALARYINPVGAAVLTCLMFYFGHFMFSDTFTPLGLIMIAGFILFSWLRLKRGNIFLANVVHLSWSLAMILAS
jgi:membrane protease YdiL (CAAX protease family)